MLILKFIAQSYVLSIAVKSLMYKFVSKVNKKKYFWLYLSESKYNILEKSLKSAQTLNWTDRQLISKCYIFILFLIISSSLFYKCMVIYIFFSFNSFIIHLMTLKNSGPLKKFTTDMDFVHKMALILDIFVT